MSIVFKPNAAASRGASSTIQSYFSSIESVQDFPLTYLASSSSSSSSSSASIDRKRKADNLTNNFNIDLSLDSSEPSHSPFMESDKYLNSVSSNSCIESFHMVWKLDEYVFFIFLFFFILDCRHSLDQPVLIDFMDFFQCIHV